MSEEEVEAVETTAQEETQPAAPAAPEPQDGVALSDLKVAYVVGLTEDGNFVFDVVGQKKDLLSLLGLHEHASRQVNKIYNGSQMSGDALVHEVGKGIAVLNQKVDAVLGVVAPKKPDNSL